MRKNFLIYVTSIWLGYISRHHEFYTYEATKRTCYIWYFPSEESDYCDKYPTAGPNIVSKLFFVQEEDDPLNATRWRITFERNCQSFSAASTIMAFFLTLIRKSWKTNPEVFPKFQFFRVWHRWILWKTHPVFFRNFNFRSMSWTDFRKIHPSIFC